MALLDDLGAYLEGEDLGVLGVSLFLGGLPVDMPGVATPDAIAALVESPGFPAQYVHTPLGVSIEQPVCQLLVRGAPYDYAGARTQAQEIYLALGRISNQVLSGTAYFWCVPLQSVFHLRQDDYARPLMTCQFRLAKSV